ncbi:MAG TPA: Clp protease N-terminal domain-containing protein [Symbiobacteriaceae bacterium]|jgi:ATP-dependent Clp protease ATP-binding subunit ClpA
MAEYTPAALNVIHQAGRIARELGYPFIQREQLFLGLLQDESVARILSLLGLDLQSVRQEVLGRLLPGMGAGDESAAIAMLPTAEQVFRQRAQTAAALLGHTQIGPPELFLGFLVEQSGMVVEVFAALGVTREHVLEAIKRMDK